MRGIGGDKATFAEGLPRIQTPPRIHPCPSHISVILINIILDLCRNIILILQKDYFGLELLDGFVYVHVNLGRNPVS